MSGEENLAQAYIDYVDNHPDLKKATWNDFFDHVGIPEEQRTNFVVGCILKQAQKLLKEQDSAPV